MRVHAFARAPHLADHLYPIWRHLGDQRGEFVQDHTGRAPKHWHPNDHVMVASFLDIASAGERRVIYVEHGAGQSYAGGNEAARSYYSGAEHPDNVIGYISPRQEVADRWGRPAFAAGAPICDDYELFSAERCAAITMHWNGAPPNKVGVPEAGNVFEHYIGALPAIVAELQENGYEVLAHHHPRFSHLHGVWTKLGMEVVTADEVRRRAQVLIADNTSLAYEMAYCFRDVVTLNAPWYRRDVEHGLRFWSHVPGVQVNDSNELISIIGELDSGIAAVPPALCEHVYGKAHSDGLDGKRAAAWISALIGAT